jgi:[acyl-carrier-protein] S-malonyltransferase
LYGFADYSLLVAREWCKREHNIEDPVCSIANYLFPHCKVIAGHIEALEFLETNYKDFNLRKVKRLPVSGAFHTELMKPAAEPVKQILRDITINRPRMPVFSNLTGYRYHNAEEVRKNLAKQIFKPVMWEQTVQNLYKR